MRVDPHAAAGPSRRQRASWPRGSGCRPKAWPSTARTTCRRWCRWMSPRTDNWIACWWTRRIPLACAGLALSDVVERAHTGAVLRPAHRLPWRAVRRQPVPAGWADEMQEIKTICHTGKKATMTVRVDEHGRAPRRATGGDRRQRALRVGESRRVQEDLARRGQHRTPAAAVAARLTRVSSPCRAGRMDGADFAGDHAAFRRRAAQGRVSACSDASAICRSPATQRAGCIGARQPHGLAQFLVVLGHRSEAVSRASADASPRRAWKFASDTCARTVCECLA